MGTKYGAPFKGALWSPELGSLTSTSFQTMAKRARASSQPASGSTPKTEAICLMWNWGFYLMWKWRWLFSGPLAYSVGDRPKAKWGHSWVLRGTELLSASAMWPQLVGLLCRHKPALPNGSLQTWTTPGFHCPNCVCEWTSDYFCWPWEGDCEWEMPYSAVLLTSLLQFVSLSETWKWT